MVWEENCQNLVLISAESEERNYDICWPTRNNQPLVFGENKVELCGQIRFPTYMTEEIEIQKQYKKTFVHLHTIYDHVPEDTTSFVEFLDNKWNENSKRAGPVLVCSSKISHCGIYIALDMMTRMLESTDQVSVIECVRHLLQQRLDLIETVEEYQFVNETLVSLVNRNMRKGRRSYMKLQK